MGDRVSSQATRRRVLEHLRVGSTGLARVMQAATEAYLVAGDEELSRRGGALYDEANDLYARVNRFYDDIEADTNATWQKGWD